MSRFSRVIVTLATTALLSSLVPPVAYGLTFADVPPSDPFYGYITHVSELGIMVGQGGYFYPDRNITRAEFTKAAFLASGKTIDPTATEPFTDIDSSHSLYGYVATAVKLQILSGYPDGTFRPNAPITRDEGAKIFVNAMAYTGNTTGGPHFTDVAVGSTFYIPIETLFNKGLVHGTSPGIYSPKLNMLREQMAKIVSLAKGGPAVTGQEETLHFALNGFPTAWLNVFSNELDEFSLVFSGLEPLQGGSMFEGWLKTGTTVESIGKFNVNEIGEPTDENGVRITNRFGVQGEDVDTFDEFFMTIEPGSDTNDTPSSTKILSGMIDSGDMQVFLTFPASFPGYDGKVTVGGTGNKQITFTINAMPDLASIGFRYEGWIMIDGEANSVGTFTSQGVNTLTKFTKTFGQDIVAVADQIIVSVEPNPDTSTDPFQMMPWKTSGDIFGTSTGGGGGTGYSQDVFLCLTTDETSTSILNRTEVEKDTAENVVVEAYAGATAVPKDSEVAIIVKVCNLDDGTPINDLNLTMTQVTGPDGDETDPQELDSSNSGIYVGSWQSTASVVSQTSQVVTVRITSDDVNDPFLPIDVSFDLKQSSIISSPKTLEIDVTRTEVEVEENASGNTNENIIILANVLDSRGASVEDLGSDIELNTFGSAVGTVNADELGLSYSFVIDSGQIVDDSVTSETTYSVEIRVDVNTTSGGVFIPLYSPSVDLDITFIPE